MRHLLCIVGFGLSALVCCQAFAGAGVDDLKKLQGSWELTELIVGGAKVPDKEVKGLKFVFAADKLSVLPPSATLDVVDKRLFSFKIDAKKQPATVDLTALDGEHKGIVSLGIYELKGDTLRWSQSDDPKAKDRPKDFTSVPKSAIYVFTFKRTK